MTTTTFTRGDRVTAFIPMPGSGYGRIGVTRVHGHTRPGTVLGPVTYEPSMTMVRFDGFRQAERVLTEYLRPLS